jgi:hypothetical protein
MDDDLAPRDGDADGDEEADMISVAEVADEDVADEVAADVSAAVGDEATDVADVFAIATCIGGIGSGSRRTPPELMLRRMLPSIRSTPPRRPEKAERDVKVCGVNSKEPKLIESSRIGEDDADASVAGAIGTADEVP